MLTPNFHPPSTVLHYKCNGTVPSFRCFGLLVPLASAYSRYSRHQQRHYCLPALPGFEQFGILFLTRLIPYQGVYCGSAEDGAFISEMTGTRSPKTVRSSGIPFCHQKAIPRPQGILCDPGFFPLREQSQHHGIDSALSCCICFFTYLVLSGRVELPF